MNRSTHFSGTPIIKQILRFITQVDIFGKQNDIRLKNTNKGSKLTIIW